MPQLLEKVDALLIGSEQTDRDLQRIATMDLAEITHMAFGRHGRAIAFLLVQGTEPERTEEVADRLVQDYIVIGHVEVAVMIDPVRLDLPDLAREWSRKRFQLIERQKLFGHGLMRDAVRLRRPSR